MSALHLPSHLPSLDAAALRHVTGGGEEGPRPHPWLPPDVVFRPTPPQPWIQILVILPQPVPIPVPVGF